MSKAPKAITDPSLRKIWSTAKSKAESDAKKAGAAHKKTFAELEKSSFKKDLGPNLDKFGKLYPDFPKMETLVGREIETAIASYTKAVKASALPKDIANKLIKALASVQKEQEKRLKNAELIIMSDMSQGIKESKKNTPPPIVVFKSPDVLKEMSGQLAKLQNIDVTGKLSIEVIIGDAEILDKFPVGKDYANASQKIKDAGNFGKLTDAIAQAAKAADTSVGKGGSLSKAQKDFWTAVDSAVDEARARAAKEAGRLGGLKAKARWANVSRGGKLVLSFAGAAAAVAALATTPFTGGVSTVAGCIGLAKISVQIGKQMADIASTAEMMANGIAKDLNTLKKQYGAWLKQPEVAKKGGVSNKMGMAELAKSGLNAVAPTLVTTIKSVKGDADTYVEKINNMEVKVDDLAENLGKQLEKQQAASKQFKALQALARDALNEKETKLLLIILKTLDKNEKSVTNMIKIIQNQNKRVAVNRKNAKALNTQLSALSSKNPLWSDVGIVIFEVTASVAFTLAGNVNAPDPYQFAKPAMTIVGALDTTLTALQDAEGLASGLEASYKKKKKKVKE